MNILLVGLRCRSCHGIIDPKYCVQTTECAAGEVYIQPMKISVTIEVKVKL